MLSSKGHDYSSASQEAYVIFILKIFKSSFYSTKSESDFSKKYRSRLAYLSQYRCDPDNEYKYLEIRLESTLEHNSSEISSDFDLGRRTKRIHFGANPSEDKALYAFNFLLLAENIGLPFHIPGSTIFGNTAVNAAKNIYKHCPQWSIFTVLRVFNEKNFEILLNRNNLSEMRRSKAELQFDKYLLKYESIVLKQLNDKLDSSISIESSMLKVLPEILSRLVTKVSFEKKEKIISFLCKLYNTKEFSGYEHTKNLLTRTINNLNTEQKLQLVPIFIDYPSQPINTHQIHHLRYDFINPFSLIINITNQKVLNKKISTNEKIASIKIKKNILEIKNGDNQARLNSSIKLITLYELGMLNKTDEKNLIKALWSKQNEYGFPMESGYYNFFFIENLKPDGADIHNKMMQLIKKYSFPIQEGNSVSLDDGHSHYCNELIGSLSRMIFTSNEIETIISKLIAWYSSDKHWLDKKNDISNEFLKRFKNINTIITVILKKHNQLINDNIKNEINW